MEWKYVILISCPHEVCDFPSLALRFESFNKPRRACWHVDHGHVLFSDLDPKLCVSPLITRMIMVNLMIVHIPSAHHVLGKVEARCQEADRDGGESAEASGRLHKRMSLNLLRRVASLINSGKFYPA